MLRRTRTALAVLAACGLVLLGGDVVHAGGGWSDAACGDVVTANVRLTDDHTCAGAGLVVGADDITIDLNGYTIECTTTGYLGIDNSGGYDGVTIKNGTIKGFDEGIRSYDGDDLVIQGVEVMGAHGHAALTGAIHVLGGTDVRIRSCSIAVTAAYLGPHGIRLDSVEDVVVQDVDVSGCFIGVSFFSVGGLGDPTTGRVQDCTMDGCYSSGVLVASTDEARVQGNEMTDCGVGIQVGFRQYISGIHISDNYIHESAVGGIVTYYVDDSVIADNVIEDSAFYGVNLHNGTHDCRISGNTITGNGARGLVLTWGATDNRITDNEVSDNGVEGITLFLGVNTGNVINDNVALDNGVWDLYHNATSTPNTWNDNTYDTASGGDID